jgi:hypothetical protein
MGLPAVLNMPHSCIWYILVVRLRSDGLYFMFVFFTTKTNENLWNLRPFDFDLMIENVLYA